MLSLAGMGLICLFCSLVNCFACLVFYLEDDKLKAASFACLAANMGIIATIYGMSHVGVIHEDSQRIVLRVFIASFFIQISASSLIELLFRKARNNE